MILRPGGAETGRWFIETVDISSDYNRAFGAPPPPAQYIAVSSDSDDTGGVSAGRLADFRFGS